MKKLGRQYQKIVDLCADGAWHCQGQFWNISKSPHKRRAELEGLGYHFEERRCVHGIKLSKDFRLINAPQQRRQIVQELPDGSVRVSYV
jgi:hypothetical protein